MTNIGFGHRLRTLVVLGCVAGCGTDEQPAPTFVMKGALATATATANGAPPIVGGSPEQFFVTMYALYLVENADCTGPQIEVSDPSTAGQPMDIVANPTLVSASPPPATYHCLLMQVSDVLSFQPDATAEATHGSVCMQGTTYSFDIYRSDSGDVWKDKDGNVVVGTGTSEDPEESSTMVGDTLVPGVTTFVTTDLEAATIGHEHQEIPLTAPVTITEETTTLTLYGNYANKVSSSGGLCGMEPSPITLE